MRRDQGGFRGIRPTCIEAGKGREEGEKRKGGKKEEVGPGPLSQVGEAGRGGWGRNERNVREVGQRMEPVAP